MTAHGNRQLFKLRLQLIGPMQVLGSDGADLSPRSRKAQALLGILALSPPGPIPRGRLAALLWERAEPDQARNLLRGAIHEVQKSLRRTNSDLIEAGREHLLLRREKVEIDIDEISQQPSSRTFSLAEAPPLLEGLDAIGPAFSAWLSAARFKFREHVRATLQGHRPAEDDRSRPSTSQEMPATSQPDERHLSPPSVGLHSDRRRRSGIRIGVAPIRSFGSSEHDILPIVLADEITSALAQLRWMSVLPSDTVCLAFSQGATTSAVSERLGLDYVLDAQLRQSGDRVQLRTSLISVHEQAIVSTFKVEKVISDILMFQDDVAAQVAASVDMHVQVLEARRASSRSHPADAHDSLMQAVAAVCRLDQMSFAKASSLLNEALRLEPEHVAARVGSAQLQMVAASQGWVHDTRMALKRAEEDAAVALSLDPFEARALTISGHVRSLLHRQPVDAVGLHRQALEMNPGLPFALHFAAANDLVRGDLAQARANLERHRQLIPPSGQHIFVNSAITLLRLLEGDYEGAASVARACLHLSPNFVAVYKPYLAALGHLGLQSEARAVRAKLLSLDPNVSIKSLLGDIPFRRTQDSERYATGLRRAGLA